MPVLPVGAAAYVGRRITPEPERELPQDPVKYLTKQGVWVWSKPREILRSVVEHRHTAVPAGFDVSKTHTAAGLAVWWIESHPPGTARVWSSAPSDDQVKSNLWYEIGRAHRQANAPGRLTLNAEWYIGPKGAEELIGRGRKPSDLTDKEQAMQTFSGAHAEYMLVLLDEAGGLPEWLWEAAEGLAANESSRILAIGNPSSSDSRFREVCSPGSGWNVIPVSVFDSPNFTGEAVPEIVRNHLVSQQWERERRERWGVDSPLYQSRVLAEFPDASSDVNVITPALVQKAHALDLPGMGYGTYGLDVARLGEDTSELYRCRDGVIRYVQSWRKQDMASMRIGVQQIVAKNRDVPVVIDVDGLGGGTYDEMQRAGFRVVPFTMTAKVHQPRRFDSRRAEMWWSFREEMEDGQIDLDPADEDLAAQLQWPRWWLTAKGKIAVETKDDMRKRGKKSPDKADAAIQARFGAVGGAILGGALGGSAPNGKRPAVTAGLKRRQM